MHPTSSEFFYLSLMERQEHSYDVEANEPLILPESSPGPAQIDCQTRYKLHAVACLYFSLAAVNLLTCSQKSSLNLEILSFDKKNIELSSKFFIIASIGYAAEGVYVCCRLRDRDLGTSSKVIGAALFALSISAIALSIAEV